MKRLRLLGLMFLTCFWASQGFADIFTWTDQQGVTHFSNVRPPPEADIFLKTREAPLSEAMNQEATSNSPLMASRSSEDDLGPHPQTADPELEPATERDEASYLDPGPVVYRSFVDTWYLRVAGYHPVRHGYKFYHGGYDTGYCSDYYYRFPPWSIRPRLSERDTFQILRNSHPAVRYIKKPHRRDPDHYQPDTGVKHRPRNHVGRPYKRAYRGFGHLKPAPTIGHHRGIHIGRGGW